MIDLVGHLAYVVLFLGMFLISRKKTIGWALRIAGDATWVILGALLGLSSCVVWGLLFLAMDVRAFLAWRASTND